MTDAPQAIPLAHLSRKLDDLGESTHHPLREGAPTALPLPPPSLPTSANTSAVSTPAAGLAYAPEDEENAFELEPVDRGRAAWSFLACAFVLEFALFGSLYANSLLQEYLIRQYSASESLVLISAVGASFVSLSYMAASPVAPLLTHYRYYMKHISTASVALVIVSFLIASFCKSIPLLILFAGILPGIGTSVGFSPVLYYVPEWFVERRGLAFGLIFGASGLGGIVYPFIFEATLTNLGYGWTLRVWAAADLLLALPAVLLMKPRLPSARPTPVSRGGLPLRSLLRPRGLSFMLSPLFLVNSAIVFMIAAGLLAVSQHIAAYIVAAGMTSQMATICVSILNAANTVGKVAIGFLCDRTSYVKVTTGVGIISALAAFLLFGFATSLAPIIAFVFVLGATAGGHTASWGASGGEVAALKNIPPGTMFLSYTFVMGIASLVGPLVAAALLDAGEHTVARGWASGWAGLIAFVGATMAAAFFLSLPLYVIRRRVNVQVVAQ